MIILKKKLRFSGVPGEIRTHDPQIRNGAKASSIDYYLVLLSEAIQCLLPMLNKIQYSLL